MLRVHPKVTEDLQEALQYYGDRRQGLDRAFLDAFDEAVHSLTVQPLRWRKFRGKARRAKLMKFPYIIVFTFVDDAVDIYALIHVQRHPDEWVSRVHLLPE